MTLVVLFWHTLSQPCYISNTIAEIEVEAEVGNVWWLVYITGQNMCVLSQAVIESMLDQILSSLKNISGGQHFTNWKIETVTTKFVT